jgi:hypothetical protein
MSSFTIPVNDPGAPRLQTFPDVIRGETMDGFLRRDRFVYATSRRLLVSVPNYSTTDSGAVIVYRGQAALSDIITAKFRIVGYAEKGTVNVALTGGWSATQVYGTTAEAKSTILSTTLLGNAYVSYQVTVTKTVGQPYVNLYGLAIYETRLLEVDLP